MKFTKWILLVFIIINQYSATKAQTCYPNDSLALIRLYHGLGIPVPSNNIATWASITLTQDPLRVDTFRITFIDHSNQGLTGIIADSLFEGDSLFYLAELHLNDNSITGLSGSLRYDNSSPLPNLHLINLSNNSFVSEATIFDNLLSNLNINKLHLDNLFNGSNNKPLSYFALSPNNLKELNIANNGLTDTLNLDILSSYCSQLTTLSAHNNQLTAIQSSTNPAQVLHSLYLNNNELQNFEDIYFLLENLDSLTILKASNTLDTNIVHDISTFNWSTKHYLLSELQLSSNKLTGTLPIAFFEQMDSIQLLNLSNNAFYGTFPSPNIVTEPSIFIGQRFYQGTGNLASLDISSNQLSGNLPLDWLLTQQFISHLDNNGGDMPLQELSAAGNYFSGIAPEMNATTATLALIGIYNNRFLNLEKVNINDNNLHFIDLYRAKEFLNFKQNLSSYQAHYIPQAGVDSSYFVYSNQADLGIGGVKRRNEGASVFLANDLGLAEISNSGTTYISNQYAWERVDTAGLIGGTAANPIHQFIGKIYQNGNSTTADLVLVKGLAATDATYQIGADLSVDSAHYLSITPLSSSNHANWIYKTIITNDSFPLLELQTVSKKIEVGLCLDNTGKPINCQSVMIQYKPNLLAGLSSIEQDSFKQAFRNSLGAKAVDFCLCGDMELLEFSDSSTAMLNGDGHGTRKAVHQLSARSELASAGSNYSLLAANNNFIPLNPLPSSSGNTTSKTVVAIIDSGLDYGYPSLQSHVSAGFPLNTSCINQATWGYNFLEQNNNASDNHGHGTAIAAIIAGLNPNNMLPNTGNMEDKISILPLKYTDKDGKGSLFNAICALRFAADYQRLLPNNDTAKVRVINASWGFLGEPSTLLDQTLEYVGKDCGILVVASAGNNGSTTDGTDSLQHWPSNSIFDPNSSIAVDNILAVAAIDEHGSDYLSSYSNYGTQHIDLAAQGKDSVAQAGSIDGWGFFEGTSFATAQVARAAALLFDKYPEASYFAVKSALIEGANKLQSPDSLKLKSGGQLNYYKAAIILDKMTDKTSCEEYHTINVEKIETASSLINIYPNPVQKELNIELDIQLSNKDIQLSLFNIQGQQLSYQVIEQGFNNLIISTENLPTGVYFVHFQVNNQTISKKFVKI